MGVKLLSKEVANKIYDVLVSEGGAREDERPDFIYHHCIYEHGCTEWRFRGHLGFGGKYKSSWNGISYYSEDETPEIIKIKIKIDNLLSDIIKS